MQILHSETCIQLNNSLQCCFVQAIKGRGYNIIFIKTVLRVSQRITRRAAGNSAETTDQCKQASLVVDGITSNQMETWQ